MVRDTVVPITRSACEVGFLFAALGLAVGIAGLTFASTVDAPSISLARDFRADAEMVAAKKIPLMLVVTREHCGYCALLKRAVIVPMILSREYDERVIIREVVIDRDLAVVDWKGREVSHFAVADAYDAFLTPAVLLVGARGEPLHEPLLGISNEEMYLFYLERAIERATERLGVAAPR